MKKSVLCFINLFLNIIVETEANALLQEFADDGKQGYRSVVSSRFFLIFLWTGVTLADFHSEGRVPVCRDLLNSEQRLRPMAALHCFKI